METFLINGAAGFLGSTLVGALLRGGNRVIGIDKKAPGFLEESIITNDEFVLIKANINNTIQEQLTSYNINHIIHLAAQQPSSSDLTYRDYYSGNVETTMNLIHLAKEKQAKSFLYTSSITVIGKPTDTNEVSENTCPVPTNHYGLTKYISEKLLEIELKGERTKVVIVRYPSLMGKRHLGGLIYTYYQLAKSGSEIDVYDNGERYRNVLHVKDAVAILLRVFANLDNLAGFNLFMAGSKDSLTTLEIAKLIKDLVGSSSIITLIENFSSSSWDIFIDISKSKKELSFEPMSAAEGIKLYVEERA